jgi:hypothetical protein
MKIQFCGPRVTFCAGTTGHPQPDIFIYLFLSWGVTSCLNELFFLLFILFHLFSMCLAGDQLPGKLVTRGTLAAVAGPSSGPQPRQ